MAALVICLGFLLLLAGCHGSCRNAISAWTPPDEGIRLQGCEGTTAVYRVDGRYAETVEHKLRQHYGMGHMRFACCGWEAYPYGQRSVGTRYYLIKFYSDETLIRDRRQLSAVQFTLRVEEIDPP